MPSPPRATFDNPYGPQVSFRTEDVLPPAAYYVAPEDQVSVWILTDLTALTVYIQLRVLLPTGEMKLIPYQFIPSSTLTWSQSFNLPPVEGYILGALCWATNPNRGRCYVSVQVMRGALPALQLAGEVLLQGYVSLINMLTYPSSRLEETFSGHGAFLTVTAPSTFGANVSLQAPSFTLWRVGSVQLNVTTSSTAGNRQVGVALIDANSNQVGTWSTTALQAASLTALYCFAPGCATTTQTPVVSTALPVPLYVPEGWQLSTYIENLQPGDNIWDVAMQVEEWVGR